jgi:peptidoglycan/LPS O-acetylase OafA/YrhL
MILGVKRSQSLDIVRGISILMVLVWHYLPRTPDVPAFLLFPTQLFWSGVNLFFVLSGFLIGGVLLQHVEAKNYYRVFYVRRAARILPLYLLLCLLFGVIVYIQPEALRASYETRLPFWAYLTFAQNIFYVNRGFFGDPFMRVTWSLAVEEQFYIFLPIFIRTIERSRLIVIALCLIVLGAVLRVYSTPMAAYVLPLQRADTLMLGVLIAVVWQSEEGKLFLKRNIRAFRLSFVILFVISMALMYRGSFLAEAAGLFALSLFYGNLLVLALIDLPSVQGFALLRKIMEWSGLRSYGIYLFHYPVLIVTPVFLEGMTGTAMPPELVVLAAAVIILCVSELTYRFVEKPCMEFGARAKYA